MPGAEEQDDGSQPIAHWGAAKLDQREVSEGGQAAPFVHKVGVAPKENFRKTLKNNLNETFFADDPFRPFKTQKNRNKFLLVLEFLFPILEWGRNYNVREYLKGDIIAGLTIASLAVPQVIVCRQFFS